MVETRPEFPRKVTETVEASGDKVFHHIPTVAPQIQKRSPQHRGSSIVAAREDKGARTIKMTKVGKIDSCELNPLFYAHRFPCLIVPRLYSIPIIVQSNLGTGIGYVNAGKVRE